MGLSRLCSFLCDVLITRRAQTASGRKGAGRSRSRRTCSRSGRSARRAGLNAAGVLVILSKHTFYIRSHLSLCQRNYEHLIVIAVPVPQIQEQNVDVIKVILQEQCQRMRFFFLFESVWEKSLPHTRVLACSVSVWRGGWGRHVPHVLPHSPLPHASVGGV